MRQAPIRVRLTAWYLTVILVTLAVSCFAMYYGLQKAIEDTVDMQLEERSNNVKHFLELSESNQFASAPQTLPAAAGLAPDDTLYQISNASGSMVFQSPAMRELEVPLGAC